MAENNTSNTNGNRKKKGRLAMLSEAFHSHPVNTNIDFRLRPAVKRVFYVLVAVLVIVAVIHQIYLRYKPQTQLNVQTAVLRNIYTSVDTKAYVLRDETVLPASGGSTVVPRIENGGKVSIGDTVADIYVSESAAANASLIPSLEKELDYYEDINALVSSNLAADINVYEPAVLNSVISIKKDILAGNAGELLDESYRFGENMTMRQTAVGKTVDVGAAITSLTSEIEKLKAAAGIKSSVTADASGSFVNTTDGYEGLGDFSKAKELTYDDVEGLLNAQPSSTYYSRVGKLITSFVWYIVCNIPEHEAETLAVGDFVTVTIEGCGDLSVRTVAKNSNPNGYVTLVLSSNEMNKDLSLLRKVDIKIHMNEFTGYEIPAKALRTVDGEKGVFIQLANVVRFRKVDIVYSDDTVILSGKSSKSGYVALYDEIIIEGTDLYDGKIID